MRLEIVPPANCSFTVMCSGIGCGKELHVDAKRQSGNLPVYADIQAPAFRTYYCSDCANELIEPPKWSPWEGIDHVEKLADGIFVVMTPSHGGVWLSPQRRREIGQKSPFLQSDQWWEEDCDAVIPIVFFRDVIVKHQPEMAERIEKMRESIRGPYYEGVKL